MAMNNTFNYEIVEHIATLSDSNGISKELNRVSYNGAEPKFDLRTWKRDAEGEKLLKGLTLTNTEVQALKEALHGIEV